MKKLLTLCLAFVLMWTSASFAYGGETTNIGDAKITVIDSQTVMVVEPEGTSIVKNTPNKNGATLTVNNLSTGESYSFIRDDIAGTLHSTLTGNTISLDAIKLPQNTYRATSSDEVTYYYSYKTLATVIGVTSAVATIIAGICSLSGFDVVAGVTTIVSGIASLISIGLGNASQYSGVAVYTKLWKITKHQGGGVIVSYVRRIYSVGTY